MATIPNGTAVEVGKTADEERPPAVVKRAAAKNIPYPPDSVVYAGLCGNLDKLWHCILFTLPPGPPCIPMRHVINFHKLLMLPMFLGFMYLGNDFDCDPYWQHAYIHGFYGFSWIMKDYAFGDRSWTEPATVTSGLITFVTLMVNHGSGAIIGGISLVRHGCKPIPRWQRCASMYIYLLGLFLMLCADAQKNCALWYYRKYPETKGLIKDGLYAYMRNPNFFGEMLIYLGFSLAVGFDYSFWFIPWICTFAVYSLLIPRMVTKDRRMSRYPDFKAWSQQAGFLLPNFFAMFCGGDVMAEGLLAH